MKILITGGAGFIGSNFAHYWYEKYPADEIVILDKLTYAGHKENLALILQDPRVHFIEGDICSPEDVKKAMEGVRLVTHFAAETFVDRSITGPAVFLETNIIGTQVLLDEARRKMEAGEDVHFHHVSTDEVFGDLPLDKKELKFTEESPYAPRNPYSASKAAADHLVRSYHETYKLPVTITNTSNNYGPWQDPEKLVPHFIINLFLGMKVPLMGKGENVRDWCYVLDHCRAIDLIVQAALEDESTVGETFCVGGNSERTNLEVTKEILKLFGHGEEMIHFIEHRKGHDTRYAIDSSKIEKMLGWKPGHNFEEWLQRTYQWYKDNEEWWRPLLEGRKMFDPEVQKDLVIGRERK